MILTKKYKCLKCSKVFSRLVDKSFVKGIMPKCTSCNSLAVQSTGYIEKRKEK